MSSKLVERGLSDKLLWFMRTIKVVYQGPKLLNVKSVQNTHYILLVDFPHFHGIKSKILHCKY